MMYPILCKVQYEKLHEILKTREIWIQLGFSIVVNWIVAPLFMVSAASAYVVSSHSGISQVLTLAARPRLGLPSGRAGSPRGPHSRGNSAVHRHGADMEQPRVYPLVLVQPSLPFP